MLVIVAAIAPPAKFPEKIQILLIDTRPIVGIPVVTAELLYPPEIAPPIYTMIITMLSIASGAGILVPVRENDSQFINWESSFHVSFDNMFTNLNKSNLFAMIRKGRNDQGS